MTDEMEAAFEQHFGQMGLDQHFFGELAHSDDAKPSLSEALEHHGVKGMKWGVIRENHANNRIARAQTRAAVREVSRKGITKNEADIKKARESVNEVAKRASRAKDQYKVDKAKGNNKIEAKRPFKVAAAELRRIKEQADQLTPKEQKVFDSMQFGQSLADALFRPEPRSEVEKMVQREQDRAYVRSRTK